MDTLCTQRIQEFFEAYERRFREALTGRDNATATAAAFADYFVGANPFGVQGGRNDVEFQKAIPQGNELYRGIGTKEMSITSIESSMLDDHHYMAKVGWHSVYEKKDGTEVTIDFSVIYMLQDVNGVLKIFAYITGDEQGVLKQYGLI